ncbi:type II secretion system F family protein [Sphingomonas sinipercae]|uniref:Type II secretion system F family protein n=1 Tax=Sphingomonas sinipercae TaxID=2714944 RepID=A0A6G7ZPE4_9SPHN|nr:type II secretion system F family protein [Sphingomonas sinipercae]QIL02792.1 type II secretion system F family protein [Sphingomonas sinipercae]
MMFIAILAIGAVGALLLLYNAFSGPSASKAIKRRMELVKERHAEGVAASAQAQIRKLMAARASRIDGWASTIIPKPALLRKRLEMTGKNISLGKYAMIGGGILLVVMVVLMLRGAPLLLSIFAGLFFGIGGPHFIIGKMITRRVNKFNSNFPDAIELMVRGLRSGLPISETIGIVATEVQGPVGVEFRMVADKMKLGKTMEASLQDTADRLGTPEFQFFVITLAIQRETGGNLAETLSNLADVLRKRGQMKLKIRAMSSESKASAYIVGSLPFVVFTLVTMINPEYMGGFFVDERLMVAGMGGLVWMGIGVFIMAKMVNFEI